MRSVLACCSQKALVTSQSPSSGGRSASPSGTHRCQVSGSMRSGQTVCKTGVGISTATSDMSQLLGAARLRCRLAVNGELEGLHTDTIEIINETFALARA